MNMLPKSIRWRLQLWHGLLLLLVLAGFGMTAWKLEKANEIAGVDAELQPLASIGLGMFHGPGGHPAGRPARPRDLFAPFPLFDDSPPPPEAIDDWVKRDSGGEGFFRTWDRSGSVFVQLGKLAPSIERPDVEGMPPLTPTGQTVSLKAAGGPVRMMLITTPPGETVVIGRSIQAELDRLEALKWRLAGFGGGVWLVALLIGGWLTGRALHPIQHISATATRIADGHLDERIDVEETESELGQLAGVLNASFERLEHSFEKQAQFTADAAHELRTPLSVVLSQAQLALARDREASEYREALSACERAAKRMQALTESLLQLSRLDAKAEPMRLTGIDLGAVATEAAEMLRPLADARDIKIDLQTTEAPCRGDAEKLGQVFVNLLSNALHHSADGSTIRIHSRREGEWATVSIADEGPGIAAEHLPLLFDRFYRADESRNRNTGGAGLGLAICKAIIEAHEGTIEARSEVGNGSEFTVRLHST